MWAPPTSPRQRAREPEGRGGDLYNFRWWRRCARVRLVSVGRDAVVVIAGGGAQRRRAVGGGGGRQEEGGGAEAGRRDAAAPAGVAVLRGGRGRVRRHRRRRAPGRAVQVPARRERHRGGVLGVRGRRGGVGGCRRRHAPPRGHAALVRLRPRPGTPRRHR